MNKQLLKALFLVSPLVILAVLVLYNSPNDRRAVHRKAMKEMQEVVTQWAKKKYVPLTDRSSIKTALEQLHIDGPPLTPEMREAYSEALVNFFFAFKDGNIESWKQYRFDGLPHNLTPYGIFQAKFYFGLLANTNNAYPTYSPHDKGFLSKWEANIHTKKVQPAISSDQDLEDLFYRFLGEITYGKVYKDYFEGICLDEMIVKHDHYSSHPPPLDKYPFFPFTVQGSGAIDATFPNEGYQTLSNEGPTPSMFRVHPTLTELLSEELAVDCINTFVYIKISEKGEVAPFLLRHVWNLKTKRWAIAEFIDAHISSYNRVMKVIGL